MGSATMMSPVLLLLLWCGLCAGVMQQEQLVSAVQLHPVPALPSGAIICTVSSATVVECGGILYRSESRLTPSQRMFWAYVGCCVGLITVAGLVAGLTLGLLSMDLTNLEILRRSGKDSERAHAAAILPLVSRHHQLLVTLLLINAAANEALPLFLDPLVSPLANIVISVTLVLLFGEIIPQASFSRHALAVGAFFAPLVWVLVYVTFPVSWPVSKILDLLLGTEHGTFYHRAELKELVQMHTETDDHPHPLGEDEGLTTDEVTIIRGALDLRAKTAEQCMTPIEDVDMLEYASPLNRATMQRLHEHGHSRIPVYLNSTEHIVGMLLVKHLILLNPDDGIPVKDLKLRPVPFVPGDKPLYDLLNLFQHGRSHMAMVVDAKDHLTLIGIITLEDVIEELIQEEIRDETDPRILSFRSPGSSVNITSPTPSSGGGGGPLQVSEALAARQKRVSISTGPATATTPLLGGPVSGVLLEVPRRNAPPGQSYGSTSGGPVGVARARAGSGGPRGGPEAN
eukprot:RCo026657